MHKWTDCLRASLDHGSYIIEEGKFEKNMSGLFQNLHDESTANEDCQVMEQLGASLNQTISIHNINEPRDKFIVIRIDYQRNCQAQALVQVEAPVPKDPQVE